MPMHQPIGDDAHDTEPGSLDVDAFEFPPTGLPNDPGGPRDYRCARCGGSRFVRRKRTRLGAIRSETFLCTTCDQVPMRART